MSLPSLPFEDSRRLTGWNLHFAATGAVLQTVGVAVATDLPDRWRAQLARARQALGWPAAATSVRSAANGLVLAFAAPVDQLLTATEVNEWALASALGAGPWARLHAPGHPAAWDEASALATLQAHAASERNPALLALHAAAQARGRNVLQDDTTLTLGFGAAARSWPLAALPAAAALEWDALSEVPIALVTGSNGKTTTTRLLAAIARGQGLHVAHTCTDGVYRDGVALASGDYSGPVGARTALLASGIDLAILETARGGLLRRGLAVQHAQVGIVTNVSDDHFGEYGIDTLEALAQAKLTIARALGAAATLVLNADDALLVAQAGQQAITARRAWFALDADAPLLRAGRARGEATCGLRAGRLVLHADGHEHDLGAAAAMPLGFGGTARYNLANIAAAALAAQALGIAPGVIAAVAQSFGATPADNPGRLQHVELGGVHVLVDYAHNPDGMRGLLEVAAGLRPARLGILLGQVGNRSDAEIRELATTVAAARPARIVLKEIASYLRGREPGAVPALLRAALLADGVAEPDLSGPVDEDAGVRQLLAWARAGDVVVLPVHGTDTRPRVGALLDALAAGGWRAGDRLPASR